MVRVGGVEVALLAATRDVQAAAPNYGRLPAATVLYGACPVVAGYGARFFEVHLRADAVV